MTCEFFASYAASHFAVQAANLALTHSRHVEELEDKLKKLQEQLEEANKVFAFIFVRFYLLPVAETVCVFLTYLVFTHSNSHKQQDLITADTAAQQLEVKMIRSEQDRNLLQQQLHQMSMVRNVFTRPYALCGWTNAAR